MTALYSAQDHLAALPAEMLVVFAVALLLARFVIGNGSRFPALLALSGLALTGVCLVKQQMALGAMSAPELTGFKGALAIHPFAIYFNWLFTACSALVILASRDRRPEYFALVLMSQCGMFFLAGGADLVTLFAGLELMSMCLYALVAFTPGDRRSSEAAIKFLLLGGFSSGILVYGFSVLYGLAGSTNLAEIAGSVRTRNPHDPILILATATVIAGVLFKMSAAPFHMWAPDAYEAAPTPVTAFLSVASKAAALALLVRLLPDALGAARAVWAPILAIAALLTLTIGNFAAMTQTNTKRLLAYSSIAHGGYMLLALVAGNATGRTGLAIYLLTYGMGNIGAFATVIAMERGLGMGEDVTDFAGLMHKSPAYALPMLIFLLSLAGIPPLAGFWGKYYIALALMETGHYWLAGLSVAYIVVGCFYYFRLIRFLFLQPETDAARPSGMAGLRIALALSVVLTVAAGVYPEPFLQFAGWAR